MDWNQAAAIYEAAGFADRDAAWLETAFQNSDAVCFAFDTDRLIGMGRVDASDGAPALRDLCIIASYKGFGLGHTMHDYLSRHVQGSLPIQYRNDAELEFYKNMELDELLG
jgi:hypothetical protein